MRGLAFSVLLALFALPARAEPAQVPDARAAASLEYLREQGAERCPDAPALEDAVSRELGYRVFEREPPSKLVRVTIAGAKPRGLRARIEVRDAQGAVLGERAIESPSSDCAELASALTLAVGLALDPSYLLAKGNASTQAVPCPEPAPCPVCPPQPAGDPERSVEPEEPSSFRGVSAGLGLGLGIAALPSPSGAGLVQVAASWTRASIGLEAVVHPSVRGGELANGANDPVEAELLRGQLALCGRLPFARAWSLDACGLGALGALRGRSASTGRQDASLAASAGLRAGAHFELSELFFVQGRIDAHANLVRTTLNVEDMPAWTSPPLWMELSALFGMRLF